MKTELLLFISQCSTVFLLGFQQQNVHRRQFIAASLTSILIGASQVFVWRSIPTATPSQIAAWLCAGPVGICLSLWLHPKLFKRLAK